MTFPILQGAAKLIFPVVGAVLDKVIVDKNARVQADIELEKALVSNEFSLILGQLEINKVQAASSNWWVSGARPFFMWVGGAGFAVQFVVVPLVGYIYSLFGYTAPPPMILDPMMWNVILGLLGLSFGSRTFEKVKGVASK